MKKYIAILSLALLAAVGMTSCSDKNEVDTITRTDFTNFFANVQNVSNGVDACYSNVGYSVLLNYSKLTADVTITGLRLPDGTQYPTMTLTNMPWNIDATGRKVINGTNVSPSMPGFANVPLIGSFRMTIFDRILTSDNGQAVYSPGICVKMLIDSRYSVTSSFSPQQVFGTTTSKSDTDGSVFSTKATWYQVKFNADTRRLTIVMNNARFAQNMTRGFNIELRDMPVTFNGTSMEFDVAAITPYIGDTPFEQFPITDLKGKFDMAKGLEMEFDCTPRTMPGKFEVEVETSFSIVAPDDEL
ncbi:MAG: hypothetical protein J6C67_04100 [Muribaculaceae bacterium]|nr:hypothetical protein [Muribaculaceae bacterium]